MEESANSSNASITIITSKPRDIYALPGSNAAFNAAVLAMVRGVATGDINLSADEASVVSKMKLEAQREWIAFFKYKDENIVKFKDVRQYCAEILNNPEAQIDIQKDFSAHIRNAYGLSEDTYIDENFLTKMVEKFGFELQRLETNTSHSSINLSFEANSAKKPMVNLISKDGIDWNCPPSKSSIVIEGHTPSIYDVGMDDSYWRLIESDEAFDPREIIHTLHLELLKEPEKVDLQSDELMIMVDDGHFSVRKELSTLYKKYLNKTEDEEIKKETLEKFLIDIQIGNISESIINISELLALYAKTTGLGYTIWKTRKDNQGIEPVCYQPSKNVHNNSQNIHLLEIIDTCGDKKYAQFSPIKTKFLMHATIYNSVSNNKASSIIKKFIKNEPSALLKDKAKLKSADWVIDELDHLMYLLLTKKTYSGLALDIEKYTNDITATSTIINRYLEELVYSLNFLKKHPEAISYLSNVNTFADYKAALESIIEASRILIEMPHLGKTAAEDYQNTTTNEGKFLAAKKILLHAKEIIGFRFPSLDTMNTDKDIFKQNVYTDSKQQKPKTYQPVREVREDKFRLLATTENGHYEIIKEKHRLSLEDKREPKLARRKQAFLIGFPLLLGILAGTSALLLTTVGTTLFTGILCGIVSFLFTAAIAYGIIRHLQQNNFKKKVRKSVWQSEYKKVLWQELEELPENCLDKKVSLDYEPEKSSNREAIIEINEKISIKISYAKALGLILNQIKLLEKQIFYPDTYEISLNNAEIMRNDLHKLFEIIQNENNFNEVSVISQLYFQVKSLTEELVNLITLTKETNKSRAKLNPEINRIKAELSELQKQYCDIKIALIHPQNDNEYQLFEKANALVEEMRIILSSSEDNDNKHEIRAKIFNLKSEVEALIPEQRKLKFKAPKIEYHVTNDAGKRVTADDLTRGLEVLNSLAAEIALYLEREDLFNERELAGYKRTLYRILTKKETHTFNMDELSDQLSNLYNDIRSRIELRQQQDIVALWREVKALKKEALVNNNNALDRNEFFYFSPDNNSNENIPLLRNKISIASNKIN